MLRLENIYEGVKQAAGRGFFMRLSYKHHFQSPAANVGCYNEAAEGTMATVSALAGCEYHAVDYRGAADADVLFWELHIAKPSGQSIVGGRKRCGPASKWPPVTRGCTQAGIRKQKVKGRAFYRAFLWSRAEQAGIAIQRRAPSKLSTQVSCVCVCLLAQPF